MVYCGKPSKGCANCRKRKIRCDQGDPACTQCMRSGKECPGYRNMLDLSFRNESDRVVEKAKASSHKSRRTSPKSSKSPSPEKRSSPEATCSTSVTNVDSICDWATDLDTLELFYADTSLPTFSMQPSVEEYALTSFVTNFVSPPSGPSQGHFSFVPDLLFNGGMDDMLMASLSAAGLAVLANTNKSGQLMAEARKEYNTALRKIKTALESPEEAIKDTTLLSVMVVALFETTVGAQQLSLKAWTSHINGATTLIGLRGSSQLHNKISLSTFLIVTKHICLLCLIHELPMPPAILALRREALMYIPSNPGLQLLYLSDKVTQFRSDLKSGLITSLPLIISTAEALDAEMKLVCDEPPWDWMCETVYTTSNNPAVYQGSYDIYFDYYIAHVWNGIRCIRIMVNEIIRGRLLADISSSCPVFALQDATVKLSCASATINQARDEILRSVPQYLGLVTRKPFTTPLVEDAFPETPTLTAMAGHFMIWPFYIAGVTRSSTPAQTRFVIDNLRYVGEKMGIKQGSNLADFLESHIQHEDSNHLVWGVLRKDRPIEHIRRLLSEEKDERRLEVERWDTSPVGTVEVGA